MLNPSNAQATTITYIQRVSLSIAIIPIVEELQLDSSTVGVFLPCPLLIATGALLSSFYCGYLSNFVGGFLLHQFGGKRVMLFSMAMGAISFFSFPFSLRLSPTMGILFPGVSLYD